MSNFDVTGAITLDDSNFQNTLKSDRQALAQFAAEAKAKRQEIINGLSAVNQSIGYAFQSLRIVARATGQALTPLQNALMGVISGTTSLALSTATLLTSTGILAGIGVVLAAFTVGYQIAQTADLTAQFLKAQAEIDSVETRVANMERNQAQFIFGGF